MALSLLGIFLIFADVFDSIGVPNLVFARQKSWEEFKRLASLLFTFTLFLAGLSLILALILMPLILKIPIGFKKEALSYTQISYLLLLPYLFFYFIFHHFGAILRSLRRFTIFFVGELIFSFLTFFLITLGLYFFRDFRIIPATLSIAQFLATLYMLSVAKEFVHLKLYYDKTTKTLLKHFFYLSALYGIFHLYILVDRAFGSLLGEKAVSALTYGFLLASALRGVLKFEHMAITSLSEVRGSLEKLNFYLKKLLFITIPVSLILFLFSDLIVRLLFGYGAFSQVDVSLTSTATRFYALSLPFLFLWPVLYRVFQIREDFKGVFITSILGVLTNGLLNYLFVIILKLGIIGICLGTFGAYLMLCGVSYIMLIKKGETHA